MYLQTRQNIITMLSQPKYVVFALLLCAVDLSNENESTPGHDTLRASCQTQNINANTHLKFFYDEKTMNCYSSSRDDKRTWDSALSQCKTLSTNHFQQGFLAEPKALDVFMVSFEGLQKKNLKEPCKSMKTDNSYDLEWYWLGGRIDDEGQCHDRSITGDARKRLFRWQDLRGTRDIPPLDWWQSQEPNNYRGDECCVDFHCWMGNYGKNYPGINDHSCHDRFRYVCQQRPVDNDWCKQQPRTPVNGEPFDAKKGPFLPGHTLTAKCNYGSTVMKGEDRAQEQTVTCQNSNWSPPTMDCMKDCLEVDLPKTWFTLVPNKKHFHNDEPAQISCKVGDKWSDGSRTKSIKCFNSTWILDGAKFDDHCYNKEGEKVLRPTVKNKSGQCGGVCKLIIIASAGGLLSLIACVVVFFLIYKGEQEDQHRAEDKQWAKEEKQRKRQEKKGRGSLWQKLTNRTQPKMTQNATENNEN